MVKSATIVQFSVKAILSSACLLPGIYGQPAGADEKARSSYLDLARQIYTWEDDERSQKRSYPAPKVEKDISDRLHQMVRGEIVRTISVEKTPAAVLASIRSTQAVSLATWGQTDVTNTPFVSSFDFDGNTGFVVAYGILRGSSAIPDTDNILEFYSFQNGKLQVFETPQSDFQNRTFFLYRVPRQVAGEERVLVWGNRIGDSGTRLTARLYDFNGREIHTLWERNDLRRGTIRIADESVILEYDPYHNPPESERITQRFYFAPNGLQ